MKTTNQFDYPTASATTYKAYREEEPANNPKMQQKYYKQVIKQESQFQRNRVKQEQQRKKDKQTQEEQLRIRQEIERKKRQLFQLQKKKEEAIKEQIRAAELAKIKQEQDRIKKIENQQKARQNQSNAQFRFRDALRRLEGQRQENAIQERQAQLRRKVIKETDKIQRQQAIKYKDYLVEKEEQQKRIAQEEQKRNFQLMRNGLGRFGVNRGNVDYSKTCFHNPNIAFKSNQQGPTAIERGESEQRRKAQLSLKKKQQEQQNRRRSLERGQKALQKISRQKQYRSYQRETEQQQIQYNLQRIQSGKRNQFVGIKPLTLAQMESNKKIRGQQQFQQIFLGPQVEVYQAPASKYLIVQKKFPLNQTNTSRQPYSSIDDRQQYTNRTSNPYKYNYQANYYGNEEDQGQPQQPIAVQPTPLGGKRMAQTRAQEPKPHKEQLSYSQSEDDSSYT